MSKLHVVPGAPNEIVMTRTFAAPRRLVVKAMTTPELIKRWLGGLRAEVLSAEVDLRVGGRYRYVLRSHKGKDFAFGGVYRELGEDRVVQTEAFDDYPGEALVTTTFTEANGVTTLHITHNRTETAKLAEHLLILRDGVVTEHPLTTVPTSEEATA